MGVAGDAELLARVIRNPGRLCLGPTTTTGSFPYGGVSLGFHRDAEIVWVTEYVETHDPMSGRIVEVGRRGVEYPVIYCSLEGWQWDEDAVQATFSRASKPTQNPFPTPAESVISGTVIPGLVGAWPPMLMASEDPALPSIYSRRPIPLLSLRDAIAISRMKPGGLPMRFAPTPTADWATNGDFQIGRVEQMVMP